VTVSQLLHGLDHDNPAVREAAILALGDLGEAAKEARDRLRECGKSDTDAEVRAAARAALTRIDTADTP
jgi:HEAT repeat protein